MAARVERTRRWSFAVWCGASSLACACSDRVVQTPTSIDEIALALPPSTANFYRYQSGGIPFVMNQYRFDLAPRDLAVVGAKLPCSLGPTKTGKPEHGIVNTNTRAWYTPDRATLHRSCEGHVGAYHVSVLIDVSSPDRYVAYFVASD